MTSLSPNHWCLALPWKLNLSRYFSNLSSLGPDQRTQWHDPYQQCHLVLETSVFPLIWIHAQLLWVPTIAFGRTGILSYLRYPEKQLRSMAWGVGSPGRHTSSPLPHSSPQCGSRTFYLPHSCAPLPHTYRAVAICGSVMVKQGTAAQGWKALGERGTQNID